MKGSRQSSSSSFVVAMKAGSTSKTSFKGCKTLLSPTVIVIVLVSGRVSEAAKLAKASARAFILLFTWKMFTFLNCESNWLALS